MESGQSTACAEAFAFKLAENNKTVLLTGKYKTEDERITMKEALAFWNTVRERRSVEDKDEIWAVLKQYSWHSNGLLSAVARLESLPSRVYGKVLRFYDIDYQSFESCLRRLTHDQICGINETYNSLYGKKPKLPRCFREGVVNMIRELIPLQSVAVSDLLNEDEEEYLGRYKNKNARGFDFVFWGDKHQKEKKESLVPDTAALRTISRRKKRRQSTSLL